MSDPQLYCEKCNFHATNKYRYENHLKSKKHLAKKNTSPVVESSDKPCEETISEAMSSDEPPKSNQEYDELYTFIHEACEQALDCTECIKRMKLTYEDLREFTSPELLKTSGIKMCNFLNSMIKIFKNETNKLPINMRPLFACNKMNTNGEEPNIEKDIIMFLKVNGEWEMMDDGDVIFDRLVKVIVKPIILKCIETWLHSIVNIKSDVDIHDYIVCGMVLNTYLLIHESA